MSPADTARVCATALSAEDTRMDVGKTIACTVGRPLAAARSPECLVDETDGVSAVDHRRPHRGHRVQHDRGRNRRRGCVGGVVRRRGDAAPSHQGPDEQRRGDQHPDRDEQAGERGRGCRDGRGHRRDPGRCGLVGVGETVGRGGAQRRRRARRAAAWARESQSVGAGGTPGRSDWVWERAWSTADGLADSAGRPGPPSQRTHHSWGVCGPVPAVAGATRTTA